MIHKPFTPVTLTPDGLLGNLITETAAAPIAQATWYTAENVGDGLHYSFPAGTLAGAGYLSADMLVDGQFLTVFTLRLQEGEHGPTFILIYAALNQCSARMRMQTEAVQQNRWQYPREGAWLKPMCAGDRVDLSKVDRMTISVERKSHEPVRWCLTPVTATVEAPPLLEELILPSGPLLDEVGQSRIQQWEGKSQGQAEVTGRLQKQLANVRHQLWPKDFSRWGGWQDKRFEATGFFRTQHDGQRWWLVDPDGYAFWSAGMDCVRVDIQSAYKGLEQALSWLPDSGSEGEVYRDAFEGGESPRISYLATNCIQAFGAENWYQHWTEITLSHLRQWGFNTVANWSDWRIAQQAGFPYVRPLEPEFPNTPSIYRDFPDVFHPNFAQDSHTFAQQLGETVGDPAFIGYFLMNEPTWGFASESIGEGMLFTTESSYTRDALVDFLHQRYRHEDELATSWGLPVTFETVRVGQWTTPLTEAASKDLIAFSALMTERFFSTLSAACREVDPHHLNLGARYYTVPPAWVVAGMSSFDVFSVNGYAEHINVEMLAPIAQELQRPVMIGEWHFGALDAGLPGSGIGHVKDQHARGQAFRLYTEHAAAQPWCVGVHYFTLYDESALGRFDGENWNIGFLDVCNRPYTALAMAARETHERLYRVAQGELPYYNERPEYLPKLFL